MVVFMVVPRLGKADVLLVQSHQMHVAVVDDVAAPLLDGNIIVAPVPRVQMRFPIDAKFEAHLRVAHEVAVLFAIVRDGEGRKSQRARLVHRLDDKLHVWRVVDLEIQAGVPPAGLLEDCEDGLH